MSKETILDIVNEDLAKVGTESEVIGKLIDRNDNIHSLTDIKLLKLLSADDDMRPADLVSIRESAFKQNQLLS